MIAAPLLTLALLSNPADSLLSLDRCGRPSAAIGSMQATGTAVFMVDRNGRVHQLDSVRIATAIGSSAAGLRSTLLRYLPGCRFARQRELGREPIWASAQVEIRHDTVLLSSVKVESAPPATITRELGTPQARVYEPDDGLLDERPRITNCQLAFREEITTRRRIDGVPEPEPPGFLLPQRRARGVIEVLFVLDERGRVDKKSFQTASNADPELAAMAVNRLSQCRFAPGRVGGVPVRVRLRSVERF
jgi:hypothetical protein